MDDKVALRPMPIWKAILLFASTSAMIYVAVYVLGPSLVTKGLSFLKAYLLCFYAPFLIIFIIAFFALRMENGRLSWAAFMRRTRLRQVDLRSSLWILGLTVFGLAAYLALTFTAKH